LALKLITIDATEERITFYRTILRIRALEETLLELFSKGSLFGTTHTSIGQEATAAALMRALDLDRDVVFSSHRCHGHFLAYGGDPTALLAEITGRSTGVCGGIGGSQHLHYKNFYSNGIQGGIVPVALGAAMAERYRQTGAIAVVFLGDGTLGEGVVYEALNMASLWSAPILFLLEDNGYAQSTPRDLAVAGSMSARPEAFGIETSAIETNDVELLFPLMRSRVRSVRHEGRPLFQIVHTYRLAPHSKGDDHRDESEIAAWRERDPLRILGARLAEADRTALETEVREETERAVAKAMAAPWPDAHALPELVPLDATRVPGSIRLKTRAEPDPRTNKVTVGQDLNAALHDLMQDDPRVVVIGEDILDPYGGAFKITRGLSTRFPQRVLTTPISEAGLVGAGNGMALRGMRPVVEIMFGDFVTLAADQIVNHAAKFAAMYNAQLTCPLTLRTPMGGRRGYGPTHSQSLESLFFSIPGLEIVAVSPLHPPGELLYNAVLQSDRPTLFIENKVMYARPVQLPDGDGHVGPFAVCHGPGLYPTARLSIDGFRSSDLLLITYGGCAELAMQAAERLLLEHEVACDLVVPAQIMPLPLADLLEPAIQAKRVIVIEEGVQAGGWGAEVATALCEAAKERLPGGTVARVGARSHPIPVSRSLEDHVLPALDEIIETALALTAQSWP
jgi:2-oxoisovalerate dehydrogenase E1 component